MRAPIALAALALAGTALLGGPGLAFADDEMGTGGADFGNNAPAMPNFGQGSSDSDPSASGSNQSTPGSDQGTPSFGAVGSVFDPTSAG
ncbi:hypothetical protein [Streptomyces sp. HD]|uniref:hypothetical protein n=1 Tax=Streptomyces sp. HD TaxID=3020892 RepID=UPI00232C5383|nr:hypothetical protein [Streptomyces sp. HD]MDC0768920.1 hypothetical protein [Streptomyces sp. HD]